MSFVLFVMIVSEPLSTQTEFQDITIYIMLEYEPSIVDGLKLDTCLEYE